MVKRIDTLNALDEALAEEVAKEPITAIEDPEAPKVRIYMALAWVAKRRDEPSLTFDDYMKTHRFRDALAYIFADPEDEADEAGAEEGAVVDPFPEGAAPADAAGAGAAADAEGPVLSGDGDQPV